MACRMLTYAAVVFGSAAISICLDDCSAACEMVLLFADTAKFSVDPTSSAVMDCCCMISPIEKLLSKFIGLLKFKSLRFKGASIKLQNENE